jgi:hypothetical protein
VPRGQAKGDVKVRGTRDDGVESNNRPPKAPTAVAFNSVEFVSFTCLLWVYLTRVKAIIKRGDFVAKSIEVALTSRVYFRRETSRNFCRHCVVGCRPSA